MSSRSDEDVVYDSTGTVLSSQTVQVDTTDEVNADTLRTKATNALTTNANYLAISSPTSAQAVAQVGVLTKECSAVIRLLLGLLDSTAGT